MATDGVAVAKKQQDSSTALLESIRKEGAVLWRNKEILVIVLAANIKALLEAYAWAVAIFVVSFFLLVCIRLMQKFIERLPVWVKRLTYWVSLCCAIIVPMAFCAPTCKS